MGLVGDVLARLTAFSAATMDRFGAPGLILLMALESMVIPLPSEAVMPLAGVLVRQGHMGLVAALVCSSLGSVLGSLASYAVGAYGLHPFIERWGKYVLVPPHRLHAAHAWLERKGARAILLSRFVPGLRHVISIPAGSAQMPIGAFTLATFVGATIWNTFLFWIGYAYGDQVAATLKPYLDVVGILLLVGLVAYIWYEVRAARKALPPERVEQA